MITVEDITQAFIDAGPATNKALLEALGAKLDALLDQYEKAPQVPLESNPRPFEDKDDTRDPLRVGGPLD